jgi:PIN domain nuclease of toxin-antitoxin system
VNEPVLHASAFLTPLNREPRHKTVSALLPAAIIGMVNLTEVISTLCEHDPPTATAMDRLGFGILPIRPAG